MSSKQTVQDILALADIKINGSRPFDIRVHDDRFYTKVLKTLSLGLGESYMDGWWDCDSIDSMVARLYAAKVREKVPITPRIILFGVAGAVINRQTSARARHNASAHYDIGNDLYKRMLDKRMIYSCAYWKNASSLDQAQENKLDLICRKLDLKPGMKLLDIGCGWGGFAKYSSEKYGVNVTGITPAAEQAKLAKQTTKGLSVDILQQDYREVSGKFDRIVSIGMMEHVGPKNYRAFFDKCDKLLTTDGIVLHHTITSNYSAKVGNPWTDKYIFPGGVLPSPTQIAHAIEKSFVIEDVENFGPYYDQTLLAWHKNFTKSYPQLKDKYDERFYRMWEFYLLSFAGAFRAREIQLMHFVMRKPGEAGVYPAIRD